MRIEDDIKLDYSDVLLRPKRSTLTSRYDVDIIELSNLNIVNNNGQVYLLWQLIWTL